MRIIDGTLQVLDAVGLNDAYTNYVQGGTQTGLQLGAILEEGGAHKTGADVDETVLKITDLDNVNTREISRVAWLLFGLNYADGFTEKAGVKIRYYAGLLSDTDLGAPFGAPLKGNTPNAIWNASFSADGKWGGGNRY